MTDCKARGLRDIWWVLYW